MAAKLHERTQERSLALQVMYQGEILEVSPDKLLDDEHLVSSTKLMGDYGKSLITGFVQHAQSIDSYVENASENWAITRMPLVDKSLLRLATYEMIYVNDVPVSVTINEAVNLAKEFGGEESPRFVNGILGRIALLLEEEIAHE